MPSLEHDPRKKQTVAQELASREEKVWEDVMLHSDSMGLTAIDLLQRLSFITLDRLQDVSEGGDHGLSVLRALRHFVGRQIQAAVFFSSDGSDTSTDDRMERALQEKRLRALQRLYPVLLDWGTAYFLSKNLTEEIRKNLLLTAEGMPAKEPLPVLEAFEKSPFYTPERERGGITDLLSACLLRGDRTYLGEEDFFVELRSQCGLSQEELARLMVWGLLKAITSESSNKSTYRKMSQVLGRAGTSMQETVARFPERGRRAMYTLLGEEFTMYLEKMRIEEAEDLAKRIYADRIAPETDPSVGLLQRIGLDLRGALIKRYRNGGNHLHTSEKAFLVRYGGEEALRDWDTVRKTMMVEPIRPELYLSLVERGFHPSSVERITRHLRNFSLSQMIGEIVVYRLNQPEESAECSKYIRFKEMVAQNEGVSLAKNVQEMFQTQEDGQVFVGLDTIQNETVFNEDEF